MNEVIYTDAPIEIDEALDHSKMLDIFIDDLINKKERLLKSQ